MISSEKSEKCVSKYVQLKAMLVRNVLIKVRIRRTLAECLLPLFFLSLLIISKLVLLDSSYPPISEEPTDSPISLTFAFNTYRRNASYALYVVPDTAETRNFSSEMLNYWRESVALFGVVDETPRLEFIFLANETQLEQLYSSETDLVKPLYLAVVFDGDPFLNMSYTLRNNPRLAPLPSPSSLHAPGDACRKPNSSSFYPEDGSESCPINQYFYSNFLAIQRLVEGTWLKLTIPDSVPEYLRYFTMQLLPKGSYVGDSSLIVLRYMMPFCMVLALSFFILYLLNVIVKEKERKIKEGLRMMGLSDFVYWMSWFIVYMVFVTCLSLIATGILYGVKVFQNSNVGLIFLLFILYDVSIIMLAFLFTTFFDKPRIAGTFGALCVSFLNLFYYIQVATGDETPTPVYWILALISPTGFALGMDKALLLEITTSQGVSFDSMWSGPGLPLAGAYIMLSFDIILYALLAYYLDNVLPSEYGSKKSLLFCLQPSFWRRTKRKTVNGQLNRAFDSEKQNNEDIEEVSDSMKGREALVVRGLSKTFQPFRSAPVKAVQGLSLDVYEGQITAILGHNGAGKTTFFNMLTGMTSPSEGSAMLHGYDLSDSNQLAGIRQMTGVCPQHDVLFDQLTPREHLEFYAKIRGVSDERIEKEVEDIIKDVDLCEKADARSLNLSGGQKRKLSIGIALIGDPKIVFLDEPTAGVDPYSRRHLWNLLQKRKANKIILLTTHFMDEADLLADRKAIISQGKLRCLGSSLFLKNRFGLGYHLTFVLNENFRNIKRIQQVIDNYIPEAKLNRHYGRELSYLLPRDKLTAFSPLLSHLESLVKSGAANEIGFTTYGVSMTTLEEVFLKLGEEVEQAKLLKVEKENLHKKNNINEVSSVKGIEEEQNDNWELLNKLETPIRESHKGQTLRALLKIRGINLIRDPMAVVFQVFLPVAFAALGIYMGTLSNGRSTETRQLFNLEKYQNELRSQPFLYSEAVNSNNSLASFWEDFADWNMLKISNYSGEFLEIFGFLLKGTSHSFAVDTLDSYELNVTQYNQSTQNIPFKHTRLRFNDTLVHLPPILFNAISNALLKANNVAQQISLSVFPLPGSDESGSFDAGQFSCAMFIGIVFALAPSNLACEIVLDREIQAKNLLRVNGLTFLLYYGSFFIVLGSMMVATCILIILLIVAFQLQALVSPAALGLLALLYVIYCPAAILFAMCASFLFKTLESAQAILPSILTLTGIVPYFIVMACDVFRFGGSTDLATGLHIAFCFIDVLYIPYGILYYVIRIYFTCMLTSGEDAEQVCHDLSFSDYMTPEIIGIFVAIVYQIGFYFLMLVVADVKSAGGQLNDVFCITKKSKVTDENRSDDVPDLFSGLGDSDVKEEYSRVCRLMATPTNERKEQPVVVIEDLHKKYGSKREAKGLCNKKDGKSLTRPAVQTLSFLVQPGEVFGLLGHNGAGKTTTMKIVTAEEAPTRGKVQVAGHDITSNQSKAFQKLGYCPQHDALWQNVTIREHMEAYAAVRGIEPSDINRVVDLFLRGLQIEEYADNYAKNCSGGTKRKLSYALAMLGNPEIVLLDEPSTGMDPQSKRFLWNTISASFKSKRGAVLTTHSMEEADALCSRLGIMVKGELRCVGTGQHLKNRYGSGYFLEVKLRPLTFDVSSSENERTHQFNRSTRRDALLSFVRETFSKSSVHETFEDRVVFTVPQDGITSLAGTFEALEAARERLSIEEYSFSQTTLEQVFLKFANEQENEASKRF